MCVSTKIKIIIKSKFGIYLQLLDKIIRIHYYT